MSLTTQEIEAPDTLAKTQRGVEQPGASDLLGEKLILNMGPSHPATHGVLRLVLELDGEIITKATPDVGYLHRGDEKIAENMTYNQFVPVHGPAGLPRAARQQRGLRLAVEKLMGWTLPPRGQAIRVICCELARISSHLLGVGAFAMDVRRDDRLPLHVHRARKDLQPRARSSPARASPPATRASAA